ncbi:ash family protein [Salmonella enterica]|nr:ash family protein [Salmonella enterica]
MCLIKMLTGCYFPPAAPLLAVGCGSPVNILATLSALSAFFVVAAIFATVRHFMAWCIRIPCVGTQTDAHIRMHHTTMSMVALAGPTSVGPGSSMTGTSTPVRAIASECGSFSDSVKLHTGGCHHGYNPNPKTPKIRDPPTQLRLSAQDLPCADGGYARQYLFS